MSLAIVRSNSLLLRDPRDKGACIRQQPELTDGTVMALLALRPRSSPPSTITYEPKINSSTVQGERTGAGARQGG